MVAKYGIITILDQSYDVCDIIKEVGKQCPIPAGVCVCIVRAIYVCTHMHVCVHSYACVLVCGYVLSMILCLHGVMCVNDLTTLIRPIICYSQQPNNLPYEHK